MVAFQGGEKGRAGNDLELAMGNLLQDMQRGKQVPFQGLFQSATPIAQFLRNVLMCARAERSSLCKT